MRKLILIGLITILTLIALYFIWRNLPWTIIRHSEIKLGDKVISNIDYYRKSNQKLPQWNDWETLNRLGIQFDNDVSIPEYKNLNDSIYELYFIKGFDGPYLMWNSIEREWKMGFPSYNKK